MNPWQAMTADDGRAMDERKEKGPNGRRVALKRELLWQLIEPHLPEERAAPVLDLGGGTGVWAIRLAQAGHSVVLVDVSPGLLARAREKIAAANLGGMIRVEEADICDLGRFADASFPLVLALGDPLSYCSDAGKALGEIHRVTATGGALIGDVENRYRAALTKRRAAAWEDARRILNEGVAHWPDPQNPAPFREFTPGELQLLLSQTGWSAEKLYPGDLVASMVSDEILQQGLQSPDGFQEAVALEQRLREDAALLGSGSEIQFVAVKP